MSEMKSHGGGTGSTRVYIVEVRSTVKDQVRVVHGLLLAGHWTRLPVQYLNGAALVPASTLTVPGNDPWTPHVKDHGWMNREAAHALATLFQVDEHGTAVLCVETRLVEIKLSWNYQTEEVGVTDPFSLFDSLRYLKTTPRDEHVQPPEVGATA